MRNTIIFTALAASISISSSAMAKGADEFRPLSEKGVEVVASRAYKGQKLIKQMLDRVNAVDSAYRSHIDLFSALKSCKKTEAKITTLTPSSKIDATYSLTPSRKAKGKGAPDSCALETVTKNKTTNWSVSCDLTMKEANQISSEAISAYSSAIKRFREDGLYSNISPSPTLTKLQQSESCKMAIDPSSFE